MKRLGNNINDIAITFIAFCISTGVYKSWQENSTKLDNVNSGVFESLTLWRDLYTQGNNRIFMGLTCCCIGTLSLFGGFLALALVATASAGEKSLISSFRKSYHNSNSLKQKAIVVGLFSTPPLLIGTAGVCAGIGPYLIARGLTDRMMAP